MTATPFIAEIKRNSLDDGPGIRSTVFFKGCPLRCVWCHNPECIRPTPEVMFRADRCVGSRECVAACARGALGPAGPAALDRERCRASGDCATACPAAALEVVGRRWSIDELCAALLRDRGLYRSSGGGVTLSGGEPTLYCEYAGALARKLRDEGVGVLLETCGHFEWDRFAAELLPHLDTVYVDLKVVDPAGHDRFCGRDNGAILENIGRLLALGTPDVLVRIPLVPAITATDANLRAAAAFLRGCGARRVALLPYNPLWLQKAAGLGQRPFYTHHAWLRGEDKARARAAFGGFHVMGIS